ncbi:MAG: tail fiber protein [Bacteroidota bacterium]|nr:tail fiber protein [Bacteroidota bacterium]
MEGVIGYTTAFAGNFAPKGWAFCQGQVLPISQNTALFSILGTTYGGNGTSNFALPDLRGRAIVSAGQAPGLSFYDLGEQAGTETAVLNMNQMAMHAHTVTGTLTPGAGGTPNTASPQNAVYATSSSSLYNFTQNASLQAYQAAISMGNSGSGQPFSTLHPVLGLNYIICTSGVFPSRN